jgi:hypothetical protein
LESALIELANALVIRALVQGYAADHRPYDGGLANAVRGAALGRRPVEGWNANAYEEFSASLAELRRELFGPALAQDTQSLLSPQATSTAHFRNRSPSRRLHSMIGTALSTG